MTSVADSTAASPSYADEVARLLWPEPWGRPTVVRSHRRPGSDARDLYVFPSARDPRLLVPVGLPGAATMVKRLGNDRSPLVGPMRSLLQASVGSPLFPLARWPRLRLAVPPGGGTGSMESFLKEVLGTEVRVGVVLGPRRVNQKPVVQAFGLDGTLLAFAKVGHNELTASLVRHEAAALECLAAHAPRHFRAPRVLHAGAWSGLDVLVMTPLASDPEVPLAAPTTVLAMTELAHLGGLVREPLAASGFWARTRERVAALADGAHGPTLDRAAARVEAAHGATVIALGGWHGDWGPWNMGMGDGLLQLWDWERYEARVPLGFDAVHLLVQQSRALHGDSPEQERAVLTGLAAALAPFDVDPALHRLTLQLYLLDIALRYADALQHGARTDFVRRTAWVVSLLDRLPEQPSTTPEGRS